VVIERQLCRVEVGLRGSDKCKKSGRTGSSSQATVI
jgi:hypothetical protein